MIKKVFIAILIVISTIGLSTPTSSEAYIPSDIYYVEPKDFDELKEILAHFQERMDNAHNMAVAARSLGYSEESQIIFEATTHYNNAVTRYNYYYNRYYKTMYQEQVLAKQFEQYPVATQTWERLKTQGFNDYVAAGILGNIMAETGGQTLNILYAIDSGSHFGMCQWSKYYCPTIIGKDLEAQCDYLISTMKQEFDAFGFIYYKGFDYDGFCSLTDEKAAARAFNLCYERSDDKTTQREKNATIALNFFIN